MAVEIRVPSVGESVSSGVLSSWLKADGDAVQEGEELFELETEKATMPVPAPAAGRLSILVQAGQEVTVGQVVGSVDETAAAEGAAAAAAPQAVRGAAGGRPGWKRARPLSRPAGGRRAASLPPGGRASSRGTAHLTRGRRASCRRTAHLARGAPAGRRARPGPAAPPGQRPRRARHY